MQSTNFKMILVPAGDWERLSDQTAARATGPIGSTDEPRVHVVATTEEGRTFIGMSIYAGACGGRCLYQGKRVYGIRYMTTEMEDSAAFRKEAQALLDKVEVGVARMRAMAV